MNDDHPAISYYWSSERADLWHDARRTPIALVLRPGPLGLVIAYPSYTNTYRRDGAMRRRTITPTLPFPYRMHFFHRSSPHNQNYDDYFWTLAPATITRENKPVTSFLQSLTLTSPMSSFESVEPAGCIIESLVTDIQSTAGKYRLFRLTQSRVYLKRTREFMFVPWPK